MRDVYIVDAVRTPRGRGKAGKGALSGLHPQELLASALEGGERERCRTGIEVQGTGHDAGHRTPIPRGGRGFGVTLRP